MADIPLPEPFGRVTMHTVSGLEFFYRHPEPPYLDTAKSCTVVYTSDDMHSHAAAVSAADNAALRERVKVLEDALRGLVACKDTEKRLHMLHAMGHGTDYDQHRAEFRFAWIAASAALEATK